MVNLTFRDSEREDLAFKTGTAKAGAFSFKDCNKEFIPVMGAAAGGDSPTSTRDPERANGREGRRHRGGGKRNNRAEIRGPSHWGRLGFFVGIVLMSIGAFSELGVLLLLGMILMFVGWFVWRPWGKDRKIAPAWRYQPQKLTWQAISLRRTGDGGG